MKRTLTVPAATSALVVGPALAGSLEPAPQEQPVTAPVPQPVNYGPDWTGFYAGGQLGYGNVETSAPGLDGDGAIGGLTFGYDYDLGNWVVGAGMDYDFADISLSPANTLENVYRVKLRSGYKVGDGLIYGTGGYANADVSGAGDDDGYFVGAGYEHLVGENLSVGGEVLYHEFDNFNSTTTDVEATTVQVRGTFRF